MINVAVIFHSAIGTTKQLAEAVCKGVNEVEGAKSTLFEIYGSDIVEGRFRNEAFIDQLSDVDAMIFGSPTFMGSVSAQFKTFADATGDLWGEQLWSNKIASGFTIGSNFSGDQLNTIQYMQIFASQHGMLWAGLDLPGHLKDEGLNRLGAQTGLIAQSTSDTVNEVDLRTAVYLGQRIAKLAMSLANMR